MLRDYPEVEALINFYFILASIDGIPVGAVLVRDGPEIFRLYVAEGYKRRGVGRALANYALSTIAPGDDGSIAIEIQERYQVDLFLLKKLVTHQVNGKLGTCWCHVDYIQI